MRFVASVFIMALGGALGCAGEARDEPESPETAEPEIVGPRVVSTERNETFPAEDPVDGAMWFSVYEDDFDEQTIHVAPRRGDGWDAARVASFSGQYGDRAPRFSPSGDRLFFSSNRPVDADPPAGDWNIWVVRRDAAGEWGTPEMVGAPVSLADARDIHSAVTATGDIFLASARPGGRGRSDIYRVSFPSHGNDAGGIVEHLPPTINDSLSQPDLYVSPAGDWMILVITDHPDGFGGDDLYLTRFQNGAWTSPQNLGAPINSDEYEYGPTVTGDGRYLLFTSHRGGNADVYRVPLSAVGVDLGR